MYFCRTKSKAQRAQGRAEVEAEEQPPLSRAKIENGEPVPVKKHVDPFSPLPEYDLAAKRAAEHIPRLLAQAGMSAVTNFVDKLDVNVLVEVIISRMVHLPSEGPPDHLTPEACLKLQLERCAAALGSTVVKLEPVTPPASPPAAQAAPQPQPGLPAQLAAEPAAPPPRPATPQKPQRAVRPKIRTTGCLQPQRILLQQHAIRRILKAPQTLTPELRIAMASKLAPQPNSPEGHELLTCFKQLLREDQHRTALDLVTSWLFVPFTRQVKCVPPNCPEPSQQALDRTTEASNIYLSALESVVQVLIEGCTAEDRLPPTGREKVGLPPVAVLMGEVPLLPEHLARKRLEHMFALSGSSWGKVALFTMRELIRSKHVLKPVMLQLAIKQVLIMRNGDLKDKAIKMLANQVCHGLPMPHTVSLVSTCTSRLAYNVEIHGFS